MRRGADSPFAREDQSPVLFAVVDKAGEPTPGQSIHCSDLRQQGKETTGLVEFAERDDDGVFLFWKAFFGGLEPRRRDSDVQPAHRVFKQPGRARTMSLHPRNRREPKTETGQRYTDTGQASLGSGWIRTLRILSDDGRRNNPILEAAHSGGRRWERTSHGVVRARCCLV